MTTPDRYTHALIAVGHLFFVSWIVISWIFYTERIVNFDTAYYTFKLIVDQAFFFPHERYINLFTQWLPLLLIELEAPLATILRAYSVSFCVLYYLLFLTAVYLFRNPAGGLFIALTLLLTMRYKFWMSVSETPSSLAFAALLIAWLSTDKSQFTRLKGWQDWMISCGLILLVALGHPLVALPIGVYYVFDFLYHRRWADWRWYATFVGTICVYGYRLLAIQENSYEGKRISMLYDAPHILTNLEDYFVTQILWHFFETEYHIPLLAFLMLSVWMLYQRQFLATIWLWGSSVALLAIITVTCSYLDSRIYGLIDGYIGWLGLVWSIPLLLLLQQRTHRHRWWILAATVLLIGFSWQRTLDKRQFFQHRIDYLSAQIERHRQADQAKFTVPIDQFNWKRMWYPWAIGVESLLLSSLEGSAHSTTIYVRDWSGDRPYGIENEDQIFLHVHFDPLRYTAEDLPSSYFDLPPGKYQRIAP